MTSLSLRVDKEKVMTHWFDFLVLTKKSRFYQLMNSATKNAMQNCYSVDFVCVSNCNNNNLLSKKSFKNFLSIYVKLCVNFLALKLAMC